MGWTHYWSRPPTLPGGLFAGAACDGQLVTSVMDVTLVGCDGKGAPAFHREGIAFSGLPGCEPFRVLRVQPYRRGRAIASSFCKTGGLPYDLCVQAVLIVLKHHLGDVISISSDLPDPQWQRARNVVAKTLGYASVFQLDERPVHGF